MPPVSETRSPAKPESPPSLSPAPLEPSVNVASLPPLPPTPVDPFESPDRSRSSLKEIAAQIQIARQHFERNKALYAAAAIARQEYDEPLNQIRILVARLQGMDEDLADELERLKVEVVKKQAQLKLAEVQRTATAETAAWNRQMVERKMVSKGDLSKAEAEDAAAAARIEVQQSELQDVALRLRQTERRRETIKRDVNVTLKLIPEIAREHGPTPDSGDFPLRTR